MRNLLAFIPLLGLMAFSPAATESVDFLETKSLALCTSPPTPTHILGTTNSPYRACAVYLGGYPAGINGYQWTITGAVITSGQGSNCIDYIPTEGPVRICVRAFSRGSGGAICYSGTKCSTWNLGEDPCIICP